MNSKVTFIVLFGSLLVNAFLIGVVTTSHRMRPPMGPPHGGPMENIQMAAEVLPPEYRDVVDKIWATQNKEIHDGMQTMEGFMKDARAILTAPEFDPAALDALHAKMMTNDDNLKGRVLKTLKSIASELPEEQRVIYFEKALPDRPFHPMRDKLGPPHGKMFKDHGERSPRHLQDHAQGENMLSHGRKNAAENPDDMPDLKDMPPPPGE